MNFTRKVIDPLRAKIVLHGALARDVGCAVWNIHVSSVAEGLRAIDANTNGRLVAHFVNNQESEYRILVNGQDIQRVEEVSGLERPLDEIHVIPVLKGAGKSGGILALIGLAILAIVLIPFTGGGSLYAMGAKAGGFALFAAGTATTIGLALVFGGISQMLTPSTKSDTQERPENNPSYIFNGAVNTYRQGNPVPIGFGSLRVGSQVISAGVRSVDIDVDAEPMVVEE